jgi:hypothetical protein
MGCQLIHLYGTMLTDMFQNQTLSRTYTGLHGNVLAER